MYTLTTKHTNTTISITGQIDLTVNGETKTYNLDDSNGLAELLLLGFDNSRKSETELDFIKQISNGNFAAARQYSSADSFEYPLSLQNFQSSLVSLARAKGKVAPNSIEIIIKLEAGKDEIIAIGAKLETIQGYQLVNKKPIPVVDSLGFPTAVKYIVSPLAK
jgi:hypothetical protein